ncbi:putative methionine gamma-lyase-like, partial [Sesbania bispinosa]
MTNTTNTSVKCNKGNDVVEGKNATNDSTLWSPDDVDPAAALASARHEFGEHGGVNMSIEASITFTFMEPHNMRRMFA